MRLLLLFAALTGLISAESLVDYNRYTPRRSGIDWVPCNEPFQCGEFDIPLDYADDGAGNGTLSVIRIPALQQPKLGTIFVNPGGPGLGGVRYLHNRGQLIRTIVGGRYDIVSWDPRGVGKSRPTIRCAGIPADQSTFLTEGLQAHGDLSDPEDRDAFLAQAAAADIALKATGDQCLKDNEDILKYVGTTAVVRDMVALHDYLEPGAKEIHYWGFSYGTVIGSYFVNMFPDRVGQVILDGVVDPSNWADEPSYKGWATQASSIDGALDGFVGACAAVGPGKCDFTEQGWDNATVKARVKNLITAAYDYRKDNSKSIPGRASGFIRFKVFQGMYSPTGWTGLATQLKACETFYKSGKESDWYRCNSRGFSLLDNPKFDRSFEAITCGDAIDTIGVTTNTVFQEILNVTDNVSRIFGPTWGYGGFNCHQWPARAVERFSGPWNHKLSNKILVIGNDNDPITPLRSAKKVAETLGDWAVLIEQDHWGHTSLAMHSSCTLALIMDYFVHNTTPDGHIKLCGTDQPIFGELPKDIRLAISQSSNSSYSLTEIEMNPMAHKQKAHRLSFAMSAPASAVCFLITLLPVAILVKRRKKSTRTAGLGGRIIDKEQIFVSYGGCGKLLDKK